MSNVVVINESPDPNGAMTLPIGISQVIAAMAGFPLAASNSAAAAAGSAASANTAKLAAEAAVASLAPGTVAIYTAVTANIALEAGKQYRLRATSGAITLTLPASPATGATIRIIDGETIGAGPTYTVARNGQTIMTLAEDMTLDLPGSSTELWFDGSTWRLF